MKRDMDLSRNLLMRLEDSSVDLLDGFERKEICYHNYLLVDAGLAIGIDMGCDGDVLPQWSVGSLTWAGHEFLDAAREPKRWKQARELILNKVGGASLAIWTKVLTEQMIANLTTVGPIAG